MAIIPDAYKQNLLDSIDAVPTCAALQQLMAWVQAELQKMMEDAMNSAIKLLPCLTPPVPDDYSVMTVIWATSMIATVLAAYQQAMALYAETVAFYAQVMAKIAQKISELNCDI